MLKKGLIRPFSGLKTRFGEVLPEIQSLFRRIQVENGEKSLGNVRIDQIFGGMRGIKGTLTVASKLDGDSGILFRGMTIQQCREKLPRKEVEPLPEGLIYLLLTGEIPSPSQVAELSHDLATRASVPDSVESLLRHLPKTMHPMTQLAIGVLALQPGSHFLKGYRSNCMSKEEYWRDTYEDGMDLIAKIPRLAALIYRNVYRNGEILQSNSTLDLAANFGHMLGYPSSDFSELLRLYMVLHSDLENSNTSAHTTHMVGSALSDAYLSYSAGLNALAGPLHGLANQESLKFLLDLQSNLGDSPSVSAVESYIRHRIQSGHLIPGYGHSVLRVTDPRFECEKAFADRVMPGDGLCRLVGMCYEVIPKVLRESGKVKNPWPNVDAHSGALLYHYGLREFDFYTVLFGVSRAIGTMCSLIWSRALGLPLERPNSVTLESLSSHQT